MKKKSVKAIATAAIAVFAAVILSLSAFPANEAANEPAQRKDSAESYQYIIKEYNGVIAAFERDKKEPVTVIEREIEDLPQGDRALLERGIPVYSTAELIKRLEDYYD